MLAMSRNEPRLQLLLAGERLIAEQGPAVALREVAIAAGQRNNSAVHYHFGSREGLIEAIIEYRQAPLERARLEMLAKHEASGAPDEIVTLIEILVRPLFDIPYIDGSAHYARFLERVRDQLSAPPEHTAAEGWPATQILSTRLARALTHLPLQTRTHRLASMATVMFGLLADHERRAVGDPFDHIHATEQQNEIISMLAGMLTAPSWAPLASGSL